MGNEWMNDIWKVFCLLLTIVYTTVDAFFLLLWHRKQQHENKCIVPYINVTIFLVYCVVYGISPGTVCANQTSRKLEQFKACRTCVGCLACNGIGWSLMNTPTVHLFYSKESVFWMDWRTSPFFAPQDSSTLIVYKIPVPQVFPIPWKGFERGVS